jgi:hypothetical protein
MLEIIPGRPSPSDRRFSSAAIEMVIADVKRQIADPMLSAMFERCFPNTPRHHSIPRHSSTRVYVFLAQVWMGSNSALNNARYRSLDKNLYMRLDCFPVDSIPIVRKTHALGNCH